MQVTARESSKEDSACTIKGPLTEHHLEWCGGRGHRRCHPSHLTCAEHLRDRAANDYQRASVWRTYTSALRTISSQPDSLHINAISRSGSAGSLGDRWLIPLARKSRQKAGNNIVRSVRLKARCCGTRVHI